MAELADTIVIVLAAGAGKRMGSPKALMLVDGQPWWKIQSERLLTIGIGSLWVVSEDVESKMAGCKQMPAFRSHTDSESPMMASVLTGALALTMDPPQGVFILPIDTPAPVQKVWTDCCATDAITSPTYNDHNGHPVYLPWNWIADNLLDTDLDPFSARLDAMIAGTITRIPTDDRDSITNLNRPEDLDNWLQRNRSAP